MRREQEMRAETPAPQIDGRVVDNTQRQNFVFAIASLTVSTQVDANHLRVLRV
jgi:hypothetical protein